VIVVFQMGAWNRSILGLSLVHGSFQSTIKNQQSTIPLRRYNSPSNIPTGGPPMPVYDYVCLECHKPFETVLTLNEHDKENPKCPHCGSKNVEQEAAAFFAVTSRKS
jgi:putative FmdB family regulatory protein